MKETSRWSVGIISTDLDLKNERTVLIEFLKEKDFRVIAFEEPNFARSMNKEKNESCLEAFNEADIGIIIIGNRYGDTQNGISITHKEYKHMRALQKYTFVFVKKGVWNNYENKQTKKTVNTAFFLEYISKEEEDFIIPFDDIPHLKRLLEGRLKNLSNTLIQNFLESQYSQLMNSKMIPALSISIQKQIKDYFIEPKFEPDRDVMGKLIKSKKLYNFLLEPRVTRRILVRGDIGSGKSTLLYANYKKHYEAYRQNQNIKMPLYVSLRGKTKDYTLEQYFVECFEKYYGMQKYPLFELKSNTYVLYIDGLDEMNNIRTYGDISEFLKSSFLNSLHL